MSGNQVHRVQLPDGGSSAGKTAGSGEREVIPPLDIHLSASGLWRAEKCPASASLPRVPMLHADADAGTEAHAEHEANCPPDEMAEVAYSFNPELGHARILGHGLKRDYPVQWNEEIPGTVDRVRREPVNGVAEVRDFKSGHGYMVASAERNLQLAHNALCVADTQHVDTVHVAIEGPDGPKSQATLDAFALADARERIRRIWRNVNAPNPQAVTGDHCWRCECIRSCPPHLTMAIAFSEGLWPGVIPTDGLTVEKVALGWEYLANAKRVLGLAEKTYRAFAATWPVQLGNGKVLGEHPFEREELDGVVTYQVLRDLHGEAVARGAVEMSATKAALTEALKPIAPNGKRAGMVREALQAIRNANGVVVKRGVRVEEFNPKEE